MVSASPSAVPRRPDAAAAAAVALRYGRGEPVRVTRLDSGHVNESFEVLLADGPVLLQWISPVAFPDAEAVQDNVERVLDHLAATVPERGHPQLVATADGRRRVRADGGLWRALGWLPDRLTLTQPDSDARAGLAGAAVGAFTAALTGLPAAALNDVLADFHDLERRLAALDQARTRASVAALDAAAALLEEIDAQRGARRDAMPTGPRRVIHGDPKFTNILFARAGTAPAVLVDYDTVMPGRFAWDFGDFLRSAAGRGAEDDPVRANVHVPRMLAGAAGALDGLRPAPDAPPLLGSAERRSLAGAPAGMAYMLAVRFLTDHLLGDPYFRIHRPGQNLDRARTQLALARAFDAERARLADCIETAFA